MKESLLPFLCCPDCGKDLRLLVKQSVGDEILQGSLTCYWPCQYAYPIKNGVPSLMRERTGSITQRGFSQQWHLRKQGTFEKDTLFGFQIAEYVNHVKFAFGVDDLSTWEINAFLDAGCGSGEMTIALAQAMPHVQVIGFDLSDSVYGLQAKAARLANCHFVQGDILRHPFRARNIDAVFSSGVLHHLPNPEAGFRALWKACGKRLYFWVYPNYQLCAYDWVRAKIKTGHRLEPRMRLMLAWGLTPFLWLFFAVTKKYSYKTSLESLPTIAFRMFDNLSPEFQFRFRRDDVSQWCATADVESYQIVNDLGVRVTGNAVGEKPEADHDAPAKHVGGSLVGDAGGASG